jgi:hypothetical protein
LRKHEPELHSIKYSREDSCIKVWLGKTKLWFYQATSNTPKMVAQSVPKTLQNFSPGRGCLPVKILLNSVAAKTSRLISKLYYKDLSTCNVEYRYLSEEQSIVIFLVIFVRISQLTKLNFPDKFSIISQSNL